MATALAAAAESLPSTAPPPPGDQADASETYIVSMANQLGPLDFTDNTEWYSTKLRSVAPGAGVLYSYQTIVQGFAARMTPAQAEKLESKPGVLVVSPERRYVLHTTRTPEYLGLDRGNGLLAQASGGSDVIIGLVDSGVWPESRSFDDAGYGPVPARWRGRCEEGRNFTRSACNNKLIGARSFAESYQSSANKGAGPDWTKEARSPRDVVGHGTHTANTAAGSAVPGAGLGRMAAGTARGMAPRARVAVYKACWAGGCYSADILAAKEAAVADGVDVLSVSAGVHGGDLAAYFKDGMAAGAYSAMEKGVFVACSAGNKGPGIGTLANGAPSLTTVGAGTIDREFPAYFILGDGRNLTGVSLYGGDTLPPKPLPLVYAAAASNDTKGKGGFCLAGTLIPEKVAGKIVICDRGVDHVVQKGITVKDAGGAGMVVTSTAADGEDLIPDPHVLPSTSVGKMDGDAIKAYAASDANPTGVMSPGATLTGVQPAPVVVGFSSRGPNLVSPGVLKPDLIAPGRHPAREFNIQSGTSMATPHVSGVAALLRGARPQWSPSAIRSALMTTAVTAYPDGQAVLDLSDGRPATPFAMGAGPGSSTRAGRWSRGWCTTSATPSTWTSCAR
ncbi:hypothetical protein PAHAL_2G005900 [Panicum hallii]|uniref:Inhibitor I9 domain-containing protein n=1 Tax=Panicum hallii TaxID=206008 RepID=A0A2S3GVF1_9POAL|nr:hypothetical protein PAHAL_2G005900 [Panicum hallii]